MRTQNVLLPENTSPCRCNATLSNVSSDFISRLCTAVQAVGGKQGEGKKSRFVRSERSLCGRLDVAPPQLDMRRVCVYDGCEGDGGTCRGRVFSHR